MDVLSDDCDASQVNGNPMPYIPSPSSQNLQLQYYDNYGLSHSNNGIGIEIDKANAAAALMRLGSI